MSHVSSFIPRFLGSNLKNLFLASSRDRELRETRALYREVRAACRRHPLANGDVRRQFIIDLVVKSCAQPQRAATRPLLCAIADLIEDLLALEQFVEFPVVPSIEALTVQEAIALRKQLFCIRRFIGQSEHLSNIWRQTIMTIVKAILESLPDSAFAGQSSSVDGTDSHSVMSVPLIDLCAQPASVIERTIAAVSKPDAIAGEFFEMTRERLNHNLCTASGISYDRRGDSRKSVILPSSCQNYSNAELVRRYLGGTALEQLFSTPLPFSVPAEIRYRGMYVVAPSGRGKTTLLKLFLTQDFNLVRRGEASIVVMNSDRDLIDDVARLDIFADALKNRLTIIEPDAEHPLALNLFAMGKDRLHSYSANDREMLINTTVELVQYMFDSLNDSPMTPKQIALFIPTIRALMSIPDASIATLRDLLLSKKGYMDENLQHLDPDTSVFFRKQFYDTNFSATKQELGWRLHSLLSRRTFSQMFSSPQCKLDLFTELNSAKVILIHTNKALLGDAQTEMFGRFFIAMILRAAQERATISRHRRMSTFIYIDECQDYIRNDLKIRTILNQCRKMRIAPILSNQKLSDLSEPVQKAVLDVGVKFVNVAEEAPVLASRMQTDPDTLNLPTGTFAAQINEITPRPVRVKIPGRVLDDMPKMNAAAAAQIRRDMVARYCTEFDQPERTPADIFTADGTELQQPRGAQAPPISKKSIKEDW